MSRSGSSDSVQDEEALLLEAHGHASLGPWSCQRSGGKVAAGLLLAGCAACGLLAAAGRGPGAGAALDRSAGRLEAASSTTGLGGLVELTAPEGVGTVEAVFTYGAPGTAGSPLSNPLAEDGCFAGLRSYTEDVLGPVTREVDAASISDALLHARMPTVALGKDGSDSVFTACPGEPDKPNDVRGDTFADWRLHWEDDYTPRLKNASSRGARGGTSGADRDRVSQALEFVLLAYKAYDNDAHTKEQIAERLPHWRVVARETLITGAGLMYDEDPVMLVQDSRSLDCALVFAGTNNIDNELATSLDANENGYCGIEGVHEGYRDELRRITAEVWPKLRPKMAKCAKMTCVGHSLGGSLCEIFAACANSAPGANADYVNQSWPLEAPQAMAEMDHGGVIYAAGAEKRCGQPPCPKVGFR